ncbi:cyclic nucleotide-binding domain-containing protein [Psychrosphaera algicola]|uniref:Cyclic nucleotide-binding domain-containing protein n=1 Tax=Psychrosphaera algicola TaxID=3023714 RepID=A0ABT5FHL2_9GAMM|nr:cyclic nucleotide-binding domain-containing protein [Psychrosphaera sp. G1-22]MDC2890677.1 cyclic nucleotide-binding domain-containing protein [Psychrosphaera sp. G1-22]
MNVSTEYLIELLKASSDFNQLSEGAMIGLAEALEVITVAGGAEVIREGAESDSMFILVSGRLRVSRTDKNGQRLLYNEVLL